jgi:TolB-like protein/Flp pilus assembly protein TadD
MARGRASEPGLSGFFAELQRRHVYKVGAAYAVAGWLLVQVVTQVFPVFDVSPVAQRVMVLVVLAGFPLALVLAWVFDLTPQGVVRTPAAAAAGESQVLAARHRGMDRGMNYILGGLLVLALGYLAAEHILSRRPAAAPDKSIAVLPMLNAGGDPADEYFSDGLSEELISVLVKVPGLKVISRNSSFQFKGHTDDSRGIGEKLGVATLLEGSVRRQGNQVRVVAELIDAADGRDLWSETYDRDLKDVFAVQTEIAGAVAGQLQVQLLGGAAQSDAAPPSGDPDAHNALLQGDFYLRRFTEDGTREAAKYYAEATRRDSGYALAYARLALAHRALGAIWAATPDADYAKARAAAQQALDLAPQLSEAHQAMGWVLATPDLDFPAAEAELRQAVALSPRDASALNSLSYVIAGEGKLTEAEDIAHQVLKVDPLNVPYYQNLARLQIAEGAYDQAQLSLRRAIEIQPAGSHTYVYLATIDLLRGDAPAALRDAKSEPEGFWRDYAMMLALQAQDDRAAADKSVQDFITQHATTGAFQLAVAYALRKEPDKMFEWLDRSYAIHDSGLTQLVYSPFITDYREDPRFAALCAKLHIAVPADRPS